MNFRTTFQHVLVSYLHAQNETFTNHPVANFIRRELTAASKSIADAIDDKFIVRGSPGMGVWARAPWVAFFDPLITNSAQRGYYPVYLFREDMKGVYLSLNQGMTAAKENYKSDAKTALIARANNYRALLGQHAFQFSELDIDLAPSKSSNDSAFYEAGNICAKFYPADQLPAEEILVSDLQSMLRLYKALITAETNSNSAEDIFEDAPAALLKEDASKFRMHKRIERNATLSNKVKSILGYTCQVCDMNFEDMYGEIGRAYIEAHHIKPLASIKGQILERNPAKDFAVLCANCHRMIHRAGCESVEAFKKHHLKKKNA